MRPKHLSEQPVGASPGTQSREVVRVHLARGARSALRLELGDAPPSAVVPGGRVPRVARLMALALKVQQWVRDGIVRDYAEAARLGCVTRARMTQIANLLNLCPELQEWLLTLPLVESGHDPVNERDLRKLTGELSWERQIELLSSMPAGRGFKAAPGGPRE